MRVQHRCSSQQGGQHAVSAAVSSNNHVPAASKGQGRRFKRCSKQTCSCGAAPASMARHSRSDGVIWHQASLDIGICLNELLDIVLANVPATAWCGLCQRLSHPLHYRDAEQSGLPKNKNGAVHRICECTRHHQLVCICLQAHNVCQPGATHRTRQPLPVAFNAIPTILLAPARCCSRCGPRFSRMSGTYAYCSTW